MKSTYLTKKGLLKIKGQIATLLDDIKQCEGTLDYQTHIGTSTRRFYTSAKFMGR